MASSAHADSILTYNVTGPIGSPSFTATFSLAQNATPSGGGPLSFWYTSTPVSVNGTTEDLTIVFDSQVLLGGVLGLNSFYLFGPQLYTWDWSATTPTLSTGDYVLLGAGGRSGGFYNLHVASVDATYRVPEPTSAMLLAAGVLALAGLRLRKRLA